MFKCFMLSLLLVVPTLVSAETNTMPEPREHHLLDTLLEHQDTCVLGVDGSKIYLNSERIVSRGKRAFLDIAGMGLVSLPVLRADPLGCFLEMSLKPSMAKRPSMGPCPACDVPTNSNGRCVNSRCTFYGFKVLTEDDVQ